jgi:hypothetical protein
MTTEFPYKQRFNELKPELGTITARKICDREKLLWDVEHAENLEDLKAVLKSMIEQMVMR